MKLERTKSKTIIAADCGNSPGNLLLRNFNIAVAEGDVGFIRQHVTDDITWLLLEPGGQKRIRGKEGVLDEYRYNMAIVPVEFTIDTVISQGDTGAVNGRILAEDGRTYAFCDIYGFNGHSGKTKIRDIISYIIETRERLELNKDYIPEKPVSRQKGGMP